MAKLQLSSSFLFATDVWRVNSSRSATASTTVRGRGRQVSCGHITMGVERELVGTRCDLRESIFGRCGMIMMEKEGGKKER